MKDIIILKLDGLHCVACAMLIDAALEELTGVIEAGTSYAKRETKLTINPQEFNSLQVQSTIGGLGYKVVAE